jgi:hypothetical protein
MAAVPNLFGLTVDQFNGVNWLNIPTSSRALRAFMLAMCTSVRTKLPPKLFMRLLTRTAG